METIKDITTEMREFADIDACTIGRDVLRRRIQHFARRIDEATAQCNQYKMREALREVERLIQDEVKWADEMSNQQAIALAIIYSALSAPPRNCERFANELDAQIEFLNEVWLISVDKDTMLERDKFENWTEEMKSRYANWLFAEAKGETNEN